METQAYFENIQTQIQERLATAEKEIDLAVAWFTYRVSNHFRNDRPRKLS